MYTELYIGLISGTSMDAVDAVVVEFSATPQRLLASHSEPLSDELRHALLGLISGRSPHPLQCLGELDRQLGGLFADAALAVLERAGLAPGQIRAIGSHGQTVYHAPGGDHPFTLQIGDPNQIAERTGITTVADFRRRDMAAGGEGAPLVPAFHAARFHSQEEDRVVLNIGGIANVTLLPAEGEVSGFDTGPGNVLMDGWIARHRSLACDRDGLWAASGRPSAPLLKRLLEEPFLHAAPPKSTGRELFNLEWLDRRLEGMELAPEDVQATLAEFTAVTIADAIDRHLPETKRTLICGGGAYNDYLVERLEFHLAGRHPHSTATLGLAPDWVEAVAFAWLARQTLNGLPGNVPAVTGARRPVVLGGIYPGRGAETC